MRSIELLDKNDKLQASPTKISGSYIGFLQKCAGISKLRFFLVNSIAFSLMSKAMHFLLNSFDSTAVVPAPQK